MILLSITTTMEIIELVFTTCTYNHHTVTVEQYQGTIMSCHTVNITCYTHTASVYQGNKIYIVCLNGGARNQLNNQLLSLFLL